MTKGRVRVLGLGRDVLVCFRALSVQGWSSLCWVFGVSLCVFRSRSN